jgi:WYL domain
MTRAAGRPTPGGYGPTNVAGWAATAPPGPVRSWYICRRSALTGPLTPNVTLTAGSPSTTGAKARCGTASPARASNTIPPTTPGCAASVAACASSPPRQHWSAPRNWKALAAANHLLIDLAYKGSRRLIEPCSLRRTKAGFLVLHAERADGGGPRTYRVDQMHGLQVTTQPFQPRFPIEFSTRGPLHPPAQVRTGGSIRGVTGVRSRSSREYVYQCTRCGRGLPHSQPNATMRAHSNEWGG